jgi:hypothetical protein
MNELGNNTPNTSGFNFLAWTSFGISSIGTLAGIMYLSGDMWVKGFLGMSYLFSISSCFTVAKVIRDQHEAKKLNSQITAAKQAKLLKDLEI